MIRKIKKEDLYILQKTKKYLVKNNNQHQVRKQVVVIIRKHKFKNQLDLLNNQK